MIGLGEVRNGGANYTTVLSSRGLFSNFLFAPRRTHLGVGFKVRKKMGENTDDGTGNGWGGPFVGPCNSFGECRFSLLEVSLGYNVRGVLKSLQAASFQ
jgi:hypothetical protein